MILSLHIPKTAGNSFRESLIARYGERLMKDYGDWAGCDLPQTNLHRAIRTAAMRARGPELAQRYDVIHGHFHADKYAGLFADPRYVAFFRDPYQQSVAHYYFLLRNPQRPHPEERVLHERRMTLMDYLEWEAFHNHQSQYLGTLSIDDFAMVGLSAQYPKSMQMFRAIFGVDLGDERFLNVNNDREGDYEITPEIKRAVDRYRPKDIELYRRALEIFRKQAALVPA